MTGGAVDRPVGRDERVAFGDWQTPAPLARQVVDQLARGGCAPAAVIEPTCGVGAFLAAAGERWPGARLEGWELNPGHAAAARARLVGRGTVHQADFYAVDWDQVLGAAPEPVLVLGNPPWVTSAAQGAIGGTNLPQKANRDGLDGMAARTGRANFDVSEWMIWRLLRVMQGRPFVLAMLCKTLVARRIISRAARAGWPVTGELRSLDARRWFKANVDAALFIVRSGGARVASRWPRYPTIGETSPVGALGWIDGRLVPDLDAYGATQGLSGAGGLAWRSGIKHDCARVMELTWDAGGLRARSGEGLDLEDTVVFPLLKGSDVANGRWPPRRAMIVPQRSLNTPTAPLAEAAPRAWAWLARHGEALDGRKSRIYRGRPRFSVFGVGPYTFAPWKVAIAGLYKRLSFMLVPPHQGRPVVFDDTVYFLPFGDEAAARAAWRVLSSPAAQRFFQARIFWSDKRPIQKSVLQDFDLERGVALQLGGPAPGP